MSLKTFNLVPAVERSHLAATQNNLQISCLEACGKNLYLGTEDGRLLHYLIEEKYGNSNVALKLECVKQGHTNLEVQKPVIQMKATTALKRILVLCDSTICMMNMLNLKLVTGFKIKPVHIFAVNEHSLKKDPFAIELCVGTRKRSIQIFNVRDDQWSLLREFQLDGLPIAMKVNGSVMCIGMSNEYRMLNCDTGTQQDLFQFDSRQVRPIVVHISRNEYLLSASNALGIFALTDGISQRPPLQWIDNIVAISYAHPYVTVLNDEFITIHSVIDQQQKQTIQFSGGVLIADFDGRVFVATRNDVYCLLPEPIDRQIQTLLTEHRVCEALELMKSLNKVDNMTPDLEEMKRRIELQAGFVEFSEMRFEEALKHFTNSDLDPRELISLYPGLLRESSKFVTCQPPLHGLRNIEHLSNNNEETIVRFERFLFDYLKKIFQSMHQDKKMDTFTAYLKLVCKLHPSDLLSSVSKFKDTADVESCVTYFQTHERHHCAALVLSNIGRMEEAMEVWKKLSTGELKDSKFPGIGLVIDSLSRSNNISLVKKHSDWLMKQDQRLAVKMFVENCDRMNVDDVTDYLRDYKDAAILFLETVIFGKKLQNERYHTLLASLYLDRVLELRKTKQDEEVNEMREKMCQFLKASNSYKTTSLLSRLEGTDLYRECALLYGKLEDHRTALNMLAEKVQNFEAAEDYCMFYSVGRSPSYRANLFETLLSIYLNAKNFKEHYLEPTISLLNKHQHEFDAIKVIQAVPMNWSNVVLENFLLNSIRSSLNRCRMSQIQVNLSKGKNYSTKLASVSSIKDPVVMSEERVCFICSRPFSDPVFVCLPNRDLIAHVHCQQHFSY